MAERRVIYLRAGERVCVTYTNWRGETRIRHIQFTSAPYWDATERHPTPQWLILGTDLEDNSFRVWAIKDMVPVDAARRAG